MAHFANIENGKVTRVIVIKNEDCGGGDFPESEPIGQSFIESLDFDGEWVQTSYNRNFRGNFAGIGMNWNGSVFHDPSPYPSWTLGSDGIWVAPIAKPDDGKLYGWDEDAQAWVEFT
jgi:hypothetical protein